MTTSRSSWIAKLRAPVLSTASCGIITACNAAAERLIGYRYAELVGMSFEDLLQDPERIAGDSSGWQQLTERALAALDPQPWICICKDGSTIPVMVSSWPVEDEPTIDGWVLILTDLSAMTPAFQAVTGNATQISASFDSPGDTGQSIETRHLEKGPKATAIEQRTYDSDEVCRMLADHTADMVGLSSMDGHFCYSSPSFRQRLGWTEEDLRASCWTERVHPDDLATMRQAHESNIRGESTKVRYRALKKDGTYLWLECSATPVEGVDGQAGEIVWSSRDVTEQVAVEQRLVAARDLLESFVKHAPVAVAMVDREMRYIAHSERWTSEFRLPEGSLVGRLHYEVIPETPQRWRDAYLRCLNGSIESFPEEPFDCRDGVRRWLRTCLRPWFTVGGEIGGLMLQVEDVTQQRAVAEVQRTLAERFEQAESVAGIGHWCRDLFSGELVWSRQMYRLFGHREEDGPPEFSELLAKLEDESAQQLDEAVRRAQSSGAAYSLILTLKREEHGCRYLQTDADVLWTPDGLVASIFGTVLDVTEHVCREAELEQAKLRAEESNRMKSEFLANMSHEIRTPMSVIIGFSDLMCEPDFSNDPQRQMELIRAINRNGRHMLELLNDILDLSKIEAGELLIETMPTEPHGIIEGVLQLSGARVSNQATSLSTVYESDIPRSFLCDPVRLRQILLNLIGNAIKFTDQGEVTVRVAMDRGPATPVIRVSIEDTGIGMSPDQVARLFQPFMQADRSTTRKYGGTGLGLVISKRLAEALGGSIHVQSELGKGSVFTIELPVRSEQPLEFWHPDEGHTPQPVQRPTQHADVSLANTRVLLVDDSPDNQRLISHILRKAGAMVTSAKDGAEAIEAICPEGILPKVMPFDLILMDMQMPVMDGYTATQRLKEMECHVPIVALTANATSGDRARCMAVGCDEYISKPIRRTRFLQTCAGVVGARSRPVRP